MICPKCGEPINDVFRRYGLLKALKENGWHRENTAKDLNMALTTVKIWVRQLRAEGYFIGVSNERKKREIKR